MVASNEHLESSRTPTTTHAEWGAGSPHLIISGQEHRMFPLTADRVSIGSADGSDLRLDGISPLHAEILHDARDEYILVLHDDAETSARPEPRASIGGEEGEVLRTGARFVLGPWSFVFARDEYADHGRPFGGVEGGEGSYQAEQPPRPDYSQQREQE